MAGSASAPVCERAPVRLMDAEMPSCRQVWAVGPIEGTDGRSSSSFAVGNPVNLKMGSGTHSTENGGVRVRTRARRGTPDARHTEGRSEARTVRLGVNVVDRGDPCFSRTPQ